MAVTGDTRLRALIWLLVVLTGCSNASSAPMPTASAEDTERELEELEASVDRSRRFLARVRAEASGAAAFVWEGEQDIALTRVGRQDMQVNLLSAGFMAPQVIPTDPAARFRWAFDLLAAYDDQPGTFTIERTSGDAANPASQAFFIWLRVKESAKDKPAVFEMTEVEFLKEFREVREPCTLTVGKGERTGALSCPALSTADGEVVALEVTWEQIGEDRIVE